MTQGEKLQFPWLQKWSPIKIRIALRWNQDAYLLHLVALWLSCIDILSASHTPAVKAVCNINICTASLPNYAPG